MVQIGEHAGHIEFAACARGDGRSGPARGIPHPHQGVPDTDRAGDGIGLRPIDRRRPAQQPEQAGRWGGIAEQLRRNPIRDAKPAGMQWATAPHSEQTVLPEPARFAEPPGGRGGGHRDVGKLQRKRCGRRTRLVVPAKQSTQQEDDRIGLRRGSHRHQPHVVIVEAEMSG